MAKKLNVPDIIQRSITKRLKKIEDDDRIDKNNIAMLLQLYQLKAWIGGGN